MSNCLPSSVPPLERVRGGNVLSVGVYGHDGLFLNRTETDVTSFFSLAVTLVSTLFLMYVSIKTELFSEVICYCSYSTDELPFGEKNFFSLKEFVSR